MQTQQKRNLLLLLAAFFFFVATVVAQTKLELILRGNNAIDSAMIIHWTDKEVAWLSFKDTILVDFKTSGIDYYHLNYKIANGKNYFAGLFLDTGKIKILSHIENEKLVIDSVTGSPIYEKYARWKADFNRLKSNADTTILDSFLLRTYQENSDNLFSFNIGIRYLDLHENDKSKLYALLPLIAKQGKDVKEKFGFSMMNERLLGTIGNDKVQLADYSLVNASNQITQVKTLNAKFIILDFWFVGCVPCMEDHQKIIELLPGLKQKQVELISISKDDPYKTWKAYLEKNKFKWQQYKTIADGKNMIAQLGIESYPTYILLDEKGKIMYRTFSLEELLGQLK